MYKKDFSKRYSADLYKKKFVKYRVLAKIILDRDTRFIIVF